MNEITLAILIIVGFILSIIFGLYLRLNTLADYYYDFKDDNKIYIKYAPIIFTKIIKNAIKIKDKKILKFCLTNFTSLYVFIGLTYCITHGNFKLTYKNVSEIIDEYKKGDKKWLIKKHGKSLEKVVYYGG